MSGGSKKHQERRSIVMRVRVWLEEDWGHPCRGLQGGYWCSVVGEEELVREISGWAT